jgi:archaellum biogenesis ATPase FlaH
MTSIEISILSNLLHNEEYARKSLPFLKSEYFNGSEKIVYEAVVSFVDKYNKVPTKTALVIDIDNNDTLSDTQYKEATNFLDTLGEVDVDDQWLLDETERFCQDKAVYNAIMESIAILDEKVKDKTKGSIPQILTEALGVSFDSNIGHSYLDDSDNRYAFYHKKESKVEFDLEYFNKITKGGLPNKTLNVALAGTGVGKTLFMCHSAAAAFTNGKNVLYITMEMAEEKIAERIDANLLNVTIDELSVLPKDAYDKKVERVRSKSPGKLIVKEYPTASAGSNHFRHLLNELRLKKNFTPDIIFIDYLNICMSSRLRGGANVNSYTLVKSIAEELRGLAVEFDVPIVTATQTTRSGYSNTDVGLEDTSESFGLPATADFMFALISSEELEQLGQIMVKQLKNRYGDPSYFKRFVIGVDRSKMRLFDVEQSAQEDIVDSGPVFDNSDFGRRDVSARPSDKFAEFS